MLPDQPVQQLQPPPSATTWRVSCAITMHVAHAKRLARHFGTIMVASYHSRNTPSVYTHLRHLHRCACRRKRYSAFAAVLSTPACRHDSCCARLSVGGYSLSRHCLPRKRRQALCPAPFSCSFSRSFGARGRWRRCYGLNGNMMMMMPLGPQHVQQCSS